LVYRDGLVGFAAGDYSANAKTILRSFKEWGESELAKPLAEAISPLLNCFHEKPTLVVPIPSNKASIRERGFNPAELIARELKRLNPGLTWANLLMKSRETKDPSRLSHLERRNNQLGAMVARTSGKRILLVDDIVTTGSTLVTAAKVLELAGNIVEGFVTFAETESKGCNLSTQAQSPADGGTSWN
jgi:ComF family protein